MSYQFQVKHFSWVSQPSAWRQMQINRARIASVNSRFSSLHSAANTTMYSALINQGSGRATNAVQAALTRIQAAAKTALGASNKQIDHAQSMLSQAKTAAASNSTPKTAGAGSILDSVA